MKFQVKLAALAAPAVVGAARVGLGVLWLHEGLFKYSANFGRADILLVADSARSNNRAPEYFTAVAEFALRGWPGLFGLLIPLLETCLGLLLILGVLTLPAAMVSLLTLMTYWSSDQLIAQYPIMGALSVVVIAWPLLAVRFSATSLFVSILQRRQQAGLPIGRPPRRWL
jgi:thiosulfate dehydrogenase (quinone) large subunit